MAKTLERMMSEVPSDMNAPQPQTRRLEGEKPELITVPLFHGECVIERNLQQGRKKEQN